MARFHHKWEAQGRTLKTDHPSGQQYVYMSGAGQRNVEVAPGEYAPYVWDEATNTLSHANSSLTFGDAQGILIDTGPNRSGIVKLHIERWDGSAWVRPTATISNWTFLEDADDLNYTVTAGVYYDVSIPEAYGRIHCRVDGNDFVKVTFTLHANVAGRYRLVLTDEGNFGQPKAIYEDMTRSGGDRRTLTGFSIGDLEFAWQGFELSDHYLEAGALCIADRTYQAGEEHVVNPTTWGPTSIQSGYDELFSGSKNSYSSYMPNDGYLPSGGTRGYYVDDNDQSSDRGWDGGGVCWVVTINSGTPPTSIDSGTQIVCYRYNDNGGSEATVRWAAYDGKQTTTWSADFNPWDDVKPAMTTAYSEAEFGNDGNTVTVDVQSIVAELAVTDANTYNGGTDWMHFIYGARDMMGTNTVSWRYIHTAMSGTSSGTAATLTIVYTAGAANHSLTAQDVTASTSTVDSSTLTQVQTLTSVDVTASTTTVDASTLTQVHGLTSQDVTASASTVDQPTATESNELTALDVTASASTVDAPTLTQSEQLTALDVTASPSTVDQPTLTQNEALTSLDVTASASTVDTSTLTQVHDLTSLEVTSGTATVDAPTASESNELTALDVTSGAATVDQATLTQTNFALISQDVSASAATVDTATLTQVETLTALDVTSGAATVDQPTLTTEGEHELTALDVTSGASTVDTATLTQNEALTALDVTASSSTVDAATITQAQVLTSLEILASTPTVEQPTLAENWALTALDVTAGASTVDTMTLTEQGPIVSRVIIIS